MEKGKIMNIDIESTRKNISDIDEKIASLFEKRMKEVEKVASYKASLGKQIYDNEVERRNMNSLLDKLPQDLKEYMFPVYSMIMDASKSYQAKLINKNSNKIDEQLFSAFKNKKMDFPFNSTVACQGQEGAYSQLACDKFFKSSNIVYYKNFASVFSAISSGLCKYGILPIENSTAGSVNEIYDLIQHNKFYIVRSARIKINHNLLVNKNVERIEDIKEIYSHSQAISQCQNYLKNFKDVKIIPYTNTAAAAKMVSESKRGDIAAIASYNCARIYSLKPIAKDIQDFDNNFTRFICISKDLEIYEGANRTSLMMILPHTPGSLCKVLSCFYSLGINLNKIESRMLPGRNFEFMFYFDIEAMADYQKLSALFSLLNQQVEELVYLGSYSEII